MNRMHKRKTVSKLIEYDELKIVMSRYGAYGIGANLPSIMAHTCLSQHYDGKIMKKEGK